MLHSLETDPSDARAEAMDRRGNSVTFLPEAEIQVAAEKARSQVEYNGGEVDVEKLCSVLKLDFSYSERALQDADGNTILGSANFAKRSIEINQHGNRNRERFTVAHEIGHFFLGHDQYLRSESIVERDLFADLDTEDTFNYERLEYQANLFASALLLPDKQLRLAVEALRWQLRVYDKGFGYIFVDDQPCNFIPYNQILSGLSDHFGVSKQAIEINIKSAGLVTDRRRTKHPSPLWMGS